MAEIADSGGGHGKGGKKRAKKQSTRGYDSNGRFSVLVINILRFNINL